MHEKCDIEDENERQKLKQLKVEKDKVKGFTKLMPY